MFNFKKKDSQIQQDVISELKWDPSVDSTEISVTVNDGVVIRHPQFALLMDRARFSAVAFVHMIPVNSMKVTIVDIIYVITVLNSFTTASFPVLMVVVAVDFTGIVY